MSKRKPPAVVKKKPRKRHVQRACNKRRYRDHAEAIGALRSIRAGQAKRQVVPSRAYPCDRCGGWHLTSHDRWDGK